jgi:hypothetical protein
MILQYSPLTIGLALILRCQMSNAITQLKDPSLIASPCRLYYSHQGLGQKEERQDVSL